MHFSNFFNIFFTFFDCYIEILYIFVRSIRHKTRKIRVMRYLHYVTDQEGKQIELLYSSNNTPKFSLECLAKIKKAVYQIWDRETNEITTI